MCVCGCFVVVFVVVVGLVMCDVVGGVMVVEFFVLLGVFVSVDWW